MGFLAELLQGEAVVWRPLGEVGRICMCRRILKAQTAETGDVPFYKIGTFGKTPNAFIPRALYEEYKAKYPYPKLGEILISTSGTIGHAVVFDGSDAYYQDSNIVWLAHNETEVLNRYLYYYYAVVQWDVVVGGTIRRLYNDRLGKTLIPIPPLGVQRRIVEILDHFAELTARRKQYAYYRDELLRFGCDGARNSGVVWRPLGEVAKIRHGKDHKHLPEGKYPVYGSGGVMRYVRDFTYDRPSVLIPRKGSLKNVFYTETPFWNVDTIFHTEIDESIIKPKYLFYFLITQNLERLNFAGGVPSLTQTILNEILIPIPPFAEQCRIVEILDGFAELTAELIAKLTAELTARRKQYAYYRDRLLAFGGHEGSV